MMRVDNEIDLINDEIATARASGVVDEQKMGELAVRLDLLAQNAELSETERVMGRVAASFLRGTPVCGDVSDSGNFVPLSDLQK